MTFRRRLAVLAASSLLLAGCAVPGQGAAPGVTATLDDTVVTSSDLDATAAAWQTDGEGLTQTDRRALATLAVLAPDLIAAAAESGANIRESDAQSIAAAWLQYTGVENPEPSPEVVASVHAVLAMYVLAYSDPSFAALQEIADRAAADGVFSPRVGEFSPDALLASVAAAISTADQLQLGNYAFVPFLDVSGFQDTTAPWAARG
ncbi:hypothetical protein [Demequina sp.]|uniref:hypothetical protein n=1 Tax=Demequina sp. TaxID=2050685 RepID=UPI0025CEF24D|nr:hypothetical protein [Demequina sp.]